MSPDAVAALAGAGVRFGVLPSGASGLVIAPQQLAKACEVLSTAGWKSDVVTAEDTRGLPSRLVFRSAPNRSVALVAALVAHPELRGLFPIRSVDVLHRSGWMFAPVNPLHQLDVLLHACLHHASTGDPSLLGPALADAADWGAGHRQSFADIVRRAGAQLPVLVALDAAGSTIAMPIAPRYKFWRWVASRSERARRYTRRSTGGSLLALTRLGRPERRSSVRLAGAVLIAAIAREAEAVPRYAPHGRWRALLALSPRQMLDAFGIVFALASVERRLRSRPFAEVIASAGVTLDFGDLAPIDGVMLPKWAEEDARLVERVGRVLLPGNPCLRTSIVIAQRLKRFEPAIRIGVSDASGRFDSAHAWVEVAGASFGEDERFAPFVGQGVPPG